MNMRIFITGDTHGTLDMGKLSEANFPEQKNLTKEDNLLILGDFGGVWFGDKISGKPVFPENYIPHPNLMRSWGGDAGLLDEYDVFSPYTVLFVDGNHENHPLLDSYPVGMWHGGKVHYIRPSVIHLMRSQVYDFGNFTMFVMGGASSTDKKYRIPDYTWFEDEMPSDKEYEEALRNLSKYDFKVDYVFTHCCSNKTLYKLAPQYYVEHGFKRDRLTDFFDELEDKLIIRKQWMFGHHHMDKVVDDRHIAVYNEIMEIDLP